MFGSILCLKGLYCKDIFILTGGLSSHIEQVLSSTLHKPDYVCSNAWKLFFRFSELLIQGIQVNAITK